MARDKVELWIRHQEAPTELEDLVFCNDPDWFWCVQTRIPAVEYCGDFSSVMQNLVRSLDKFIWRIEGRDCSLNHGDLIVVPGSNIGLVYARHIQTQDLGWLKHLSCDLGLYWACLDLKRFLGTGGDHPLNLEVSKFTTDITSSGVKKGFVGL